MKRIRNIVLVVATVCLVTLSQAHASPDAPKIRVVNFKSCIEKSKQGKQEQASFESLKKQMETTLADKEKTLNDMATKFEDPDYLDSLSADAETELKRKFRKLNQEYTQLQSQYMQALQQTNFKVIQKLTEVVTKASATVAKQENLDVILNDESTFFASPDMDISNKVVAAMDQLFEKEEIENKSSKAATEPVATPPMGNMRK